MKIRRIAASILAATLFVSNTSLAAGWVQDNVGWWYDIGNAGYPAQSWYYIDGNWYYFNEAGYMETGFIDFQGNTFYCYENGAMATGWVWLDEWYYFDSNGAMARSRWIGDYYLKSDGRMARSQEINGYWVDESGKWTDNPSDGIDDEVWEADDYEADVNEDAEEIRETQSNQDNYTTQPKEASTLSISGHQPLSGDYSMGTTIVPTGVIESNYEIETVTVNLRVHYMGVKDYTKTYPINANRVDLEELDLSYFDTKQFTMSGAGYQFTVSAKDASGEERQLVNDYFNMKYTERLECTLEDYQEIGESVPEGTDYEVNGIIYSNYPIVSVIVSIKSRRDGTVLAREQVEPYTTEYDLAEMRDLFDFGGLEAGKYRYTITARTGGASRTLANEMFEVEEASSGGSALLYSINAMFDEWDDGTKAYTNGSRSFSGHILSDAKSRIKKRYSNAHKYVEFEWKNSEDVRGNHVYAHSEGIVASANSNSGIVEIKHTNGYTVKYTGLEELYVSKGWGVDGNTTVGEIPKNGCVSVYLLDENGENLNISDYLDSNF